MTMQLRSTTTSWGSLTKALHWVIALAIIGLCAVGWYMEDLKPTPLKKTLFDLHKSTGLTVLALVAVRIVWRLFEKARPDLPAAMPRWELLAARWSHVLLYVMTLLMPLSGWLLHSAGGYPLKWFGLFAVPSLAPAGDALKSFAGNVHLWGFWVLAALFAVHVGAALKHHFIDRDAVLREMLPGRLPGREPMTVPETRA